MTENISITERTTPEKFGRSSFQGQRDLIDQSMAEATWAVRSHETGPVIMQLRERAGAVQRRASVFLGLLLISVLAGLVWFVGVPLWQEREAQSQNAQSAEQRGALEEREQALQEDIASLRERAANRVSIDWTRQDSGIGAVVLAGSFVDAQTGWAVGDTGTILATANGGSSWTRQDGGTGETLFSVSFVDKQTGWAVGWDGTILATADGGSRWTQQDSGTDALLLSISFVNAQTGWAVGWDGTILAAANGGSRWTEQYSGTVEKLSSVNFVDSQAGWAVGDNGTILATADGGSRWTTQASGTDSDLNSVTFVDAQTGWAVGENGTILATANGGSSWTQQDSETNEFLRSVSFFDAQTGWAVGDNGTILATANGGSSWTPQDGGTDKILFSVSFVDAQNGWVVGEGGTILRSSGQDRAFILQSVGLGQLQQQIALTNGRIDVDLSQELQDLARLAEEQEALSRDRTRLASAQVASTPQEQALLAAADLVRNANTDEARSKAEAALSAALAQQQGGFSVWKEYADQIPAGILLLFLLATLSALYRYNSRIAGFYHARADALELLALDTPPDQEKFEQLAATLAAERVEFKGTKTPADMATDLTKEVIAKLNLKPSS